MHQRLTFLSVAALALAVAVGCGGPKSESESTAGSGAKTIPGKGPKIAVIPKGTTHVFWKSVEKGAVNASLETGCEIIWKGPLKENDRAQQIQIVQDFISQRVAGIVLAPLDNEALAPQVQAATAAGIPVVIIDSGLNAEAGKDFISFVATNNYNAGTMAGDEMIRLLGGKGKVAILRYQEGSASTMEREKGFLEAVKKAPGIEVIVENRYGGATAGEAQQAAQNMLDQLQQADGIFCPNESTTFGMLNAMKSANLAGKKKFVGFDSSPPLIDGLNAGEIHALVVQDPVRMGYLGVKTLMESLQKKEVKVEVDTGAYLVTKENLSDPNIKALVGP